MYIYLYITYIEEYIRGVCLAVCLSPFTALQYTKFIEFNMHIAIKFMHFSFSYFFSYAVLSSHSLFPLIHSTSFNRPLPLLSLNFQRKAQICFCFCVSAGCNGFSIWFFFILVTNLIGVVAKMFHYSLINI